MVKKFCFVFRSCRGVLVLLVLLLFTLPARTQVDRRTLFDVLKEYRYSNRYLAAYRALDAFPAPDQQSRWMKWQLELTYASFVTDFPAYDSLLVHFQRPPSRDSVFQILESQAVRGPEVYQRLLSAARSSRMVMINENHFVPRHRRFLSRLLPGLRRLGFRYLAVEALFSDTLLNQPDGFPTVENGFYVKEPGFGRLLRLARKLGFVLLKYDAHDQKGDRERLQAENLFRQTFQVDSTARVVVLAGIAHIFEQPTAAGKKWMAQIFRETYGIDPLTVDQTSLDPYHMLLNDSLALVRSTELPSSRLKRADFLLVNHLPVNDLASTGQRVAFTSPFNEPVQLNLFLKQEVERMGGFDRLIPFQAVYLPPGASVELTLPPQAFQLVVYDATGKVRLNRELLAQREADAP